MRNKGIHLRNIAAALFALAASLPFTLLAEMSPSDRAMVRERNEIRNSGDMSIEPLEKKPKRKETGFFFHHRSKVPPNEQLAEAVALENAGKRSDACKAYDRLGLTSETEEILGVKIPRVTIPVTPGRNLAVILELAAMNNRQKKMGYNAAEMLAAEHDFAVDNGTV